MFVFGGTFTYYLIGIPIGYCYYRYDDREKFAA